MSIRLQWDTTKIHRGYCNNPHKNYLYYCHGLCGGLHCLACWASNYPGKRNISNWSFSKGDLLFYMKKKDKEKNNTNILLNALTIIHNYCKKCESCICFDELKCILKGIPSNWDLNKIQERIDYGMD